MKTVCRDCVHRDICKLEISLTSDIHCNHYLSSNRTTQVQRFSPAVQFNFIETAEAIMVNDGRGGVCKILGLCALG